MNQKGQSVLEALILLPATVLLFVVLAGILMNSIQLTYLNDIAEEALICARENKTQCEFQAEQKIKQVGYKLINLEIHDVFQKKRIRIEYLDMIHKNQTLERWIAVNEKK